MAAAKTQMIKKKKKEKNNAPVKASEEKGRL